MSEKIKIMGDQILIQAPGDKVTTGGILITADIREQSESEGQVLAVGNKCKQTTVGDYVLFGMQSSSNFSRHGEKFLLIREAAIIGHISENIPANTPDVYTFQTEESS